MSKYRTKKDIIIPKGTVFEDISGMRKIYYDAHETILELGKDNCMTVNFTYADDSVTNEYFEEIE